MPQPWRVLLAPLKGRPPCLSVCQAAAPSARSRANKGSGCGRRPPSARRLQPLAQGPADAGQLPGDGGLHRHRRLAHGGLLSLQPGGRGQRRRHAGLHDRRWPVPRPCRGHGACSVLRANGPKPFAACGAGSNASRVAPAPPQGGELLCCDGCNCAFHTECVNLHTVPTVSPAASEAGCLLAPAPSLLAAAHAPAAVRLPAGQAAPVWPASRTPLSHFAPGQPYLPASVPPQGDWFCPLCVQQGITSKPEPLPLQPKQVRVLCRCCHWLD